MILPICTYQSFELLRLLTIYNDGALPKPCPMVPSLPVPVHVTIENPASTFADTDDVILPSLFVTVASPAFQHHATKVSLLSL